MQVTKYHRLGGLKSRNLSLTGGWEVPRSRWQSVLFPDFALPCRQPLFCCALMGERKREWKRERWSLLFLLRTLILSWRPILMISTKSNCFFKAQPPSTIILDVRASTYKFWGGHKYSIYNIRKRMLATIISSNLYL